MIMEESVSLSPHGLRPVYLHNKNYLIKNYLILIKQSIILLLSKKYIQKIPHSAKRQRPNGPSTGARLNRPPWAASFCSSFFLLKSHFSDLKSLSFFILLHATEVFNNTNPIKSSYPLFHHGH